MRNSVVFNKWFNKYLFFNKAFEIQLMICNTFDPIFTINFYLTRKTDHAGIGLELCLLGISFTSSIYDIRHWDYEKNCWSKL